MNLPTNFAEACTRPSAYLPVALSLTAMTFVLIQLSSHGVAREADEGAVAHLWQLAMVAQAPIIAYSAARWLPKAPRLGLQILGLQLVAALGALLPVYLLQW